MKRNKVLLGLFVGLMTLAGGLANAQTSSNKFYEIGPSNVSGKISSLVLGPQDPANTTIYAGSVSGGLYVRTSNADVLNALYANDNSLSAQRRAQLTADFGTWHYVRYIRPTDNREVALPISKMVACPEDGSIYIATGASDHSIGTNYDPRHVPMGCGIFRYNTADGTFTLINESDDQRFRTVNDLEYIHRDGTLYLYVATNNGLFRWKVSDQDAANGAWEYTAPLTISDQAPFFDISISGTLRTVYVSSRYAPARLFKIGDATAEDDAVLASFVDITASFPNTTSTGSIFLTTSPSNPSYTYAMCLNQYMNTIVVYLTTNGQTWNTLSTASVTPFSYNYGGCGAITVDPKNPKRIIVAGSDVWVGEGHVDDSYFQWTSASSNEYYLMAIPPATGDFMDRVFNSSSYVHSGINDILPVPTTIDGQTFYTYYFATDGGVFFGSDGFYTNPTTGENTIIDGGGFSSFDNANRGLNTTRINGLSVAPDGTIVAGTASNACAVIEPHLAHVGGQPNYSWFDNGSLGNVNHSANIIWRPGAGGATAASAFQQYAPNTRRTIFVSAPFGQLGRTYTDYLDYTNPTTWTINEGFMSNEIIGGPNTGTLYLWETDTNTVFNYPVRGIIDTLGYILRDGDTVLVNDPIHGANRGSKFQLRPGDTAIFYSRGNADYPFKYVYTENKTAADTIETVNPIQARMVTIGDQNPGGIVSVSSVSAVWYSWCPTDFTKVWDETQYAEGQTTPALRERLHFWSPIFAIRRRAGSYTENLYPRNAVISNNGLVVYVSAYDTRNDSSMLFRISGFEKVDFSQTNYAIKDALKFDNLESVLKVDTFSYEGSHWFPRAISSIAVDPRAGSDRLILTFDGYSYSLSYPNIMVVENASTSLDSITPIPLENLPQIPAYTALIEDSTGNYYVGTEKGVFVKEGNASWQILENIPEVPVTSIYQQTKNLPIRRNLTHTGITANNFVFAKTKWPRAIYFGTHGRGIFMDMTYVTDTINEIVDSTDYAPTVGIPTVQNIGLNSVSLYPNPVTTEANITVNSAVAGTAVIRVYDLNGRCVVDRNLGFATEGENNYTLQTQGMSKGMYLVNVIIGGHTAATKMMVR